MKHAAIYGIYFGWQRVKVPIALNPGVDNGASLIFG